MSELTTREWLIVEPETTDPELDEGPKAHIVRVKPGEDAATKVLEARITGTPLTALCGHVWVPSRDPHQVPRCEQCVEIYNMHRSFSDDVTRDSGDLPS